MITALIENSLRLALDSAPWLLFGLIAAGVIHAWLPMRLVGRALGGSGPAAVIKAALIGAPLPLCSCGTLPAALSLSRAGASRASTTSFLISTPETGVDSVALSWVLLGPVLALLRPVAAIISAVSAGLLVGAAEVRSEQDET
ncbi:MAG: permease, partial [Gammaproteobacteria bacterium]|nr:permease [Gammaproteobacteria bacterium]